MWLMIAVLSIIFAGHSCTQFELNQEECLLISQDHSIAIDITRITRIETWGNLTVHMSLCPQQQDDWRCPEDVFVCTTDPMSGQIVDLGSKIDNITEDESLITINLISTKAQGKFIISCRDDILSDEAGIVPTEFKTDKNKLIVYSVPWMSKYACPEKLHRAVNRCILFTGIYSYDLRPLRHSNDFEVKVPRGKFLISICRNVSSSACKGSSVCDLSGRKPIASLRGAVLQYLHGRDLTLTYNHFKNNGKTVIKFICSSKDNGSVINYEKKIGNSYFFTFLTPVACERPKMNCMLYDKQRGNYYDLTRLNKITGNWEVDLDDGTTIMFNLCHPMNYVPYTPCTGMNVFLCLQDSLNNTLATADSAISSFDYPGHLSVKFSGTTMDGRPFFTNISISCHEHGFYPTNYSRFDGSTELYVFWKSTAGCPQKMAQGQKCVIKNLYHDVEMDISALHGEKDYLLKSPDGYSLRINVCGSLKEPCEKVKDTSACYKNRLGEEWPVGALGGSNPIFQDGQFLFQIAGGPCSNNTIRTKITVVLSCEYFEDDTKYLEPEFIQRVNDCEFYVIWKTSLVCEKRTVSNCTLKKEDKKYDLTPLKSLKENYLVHHTKEVEFSLNVCHSIIQGEHRARCKSNAGACIINNSVNYLLSEDYEKSISQETIGLVSVNGNLEFKDDNLVIKYLGGSVCMDDKSHHGFISSIITFHCDEEATNSTPRFFGYKDCTYFFDWTTKYACPLFDKNSSIETSTVTPKGPRKKSCILEFPERSLSFDLGPLMNQSWPVRHSNITLSVCNPVNSESCPNSSGACEKLKDSYLNVGDFNTDLRYEQKSLHLIYEAPETKQRTVIEFICNKNNSGPIFIEKVPGLIFHNTTVIAWPTEIACLKEEYEKCCNEIEDLCSNYTSVYPVNAPDNTTIFLSLCRPVIPVTGLLCTNSSLSCAATSTDDHQHFYNEQSLGNKFQPAEHHFDKSISLKYTGGTPCLKSPTRSYSTYIKFFCDQNQKTDYPKFHELKSGCQYSIDWGTPLLCSSKSSTEKSDECPLFSNATSSPALRYSSFVVHGSNRAYIIDLCQSTHCGSDICTAWMIGLEWKPFAVKKSQSFHSSSVVMNFTNSRDPQNHSCGATVELSCDPSALEEEEHITIVEETECYIHIIRKGNIGCLLTGGGQPPKPKEPEQTHEAGISRVWWFLLVTLCCTIFFGGLYFVYNRKRDEEGRNPFQIFIYSRLRAERD